MDREASQDQRVARQKHLCSRILLEKVAQENDKRSEVLQTRDRIAKAHEMSLQEKQTVLNERDKQFREEAV